MKYHGFSMFLQKVALLRTFAARTARILRFMLQPCSYPAKLYQKIWDQWIEKYMVSGSFYRTPSYFMGKNTCVTCVPCSLQVVHVFFTQIHRQSSIGPPSQLESLLNCLHLGIKSWVSSFSDTLTHPNILSLINLFVYYSHTHPTIRSSSLCQQISSKKSISTINMIGLP